MSVANHGSDAGAGSVVSHGVSAVGCVESGGRSAGSPRPMVGVVARWFGKQSEVWAWRQVTMFRRFRPSVICWTRENEERLPLKDTPVHLVPSEQEPNNGGRRWLWRVGNLGKMNFYGTQGAERKKLRRILGESGASVLLCHFGQVGLRLLPAARDLGIPVVVHFHGQDISSALGNRWYRWSLRRQLPKFAAAVCVGSHQRERLIRLGMPGERIHLIPCGVPTEDFRPSPREHGGGVTFICVTRLVAWKGVAHVISAFETVAREMADCRLVIVGDGPEMEALKRQAEIAGLGHRVHFEGEQPARRIKELLEASDVFLQHSLTDASGWDEGFGVSIAEAAAMNLPVIVSDCGGITDQVVDGETGVVVAERDDRAMAQAMLRLGRDPEVRVKMGGAGRTRMIEHFDTRLQVGKLEEVLHQASK